MCIRDSIETAGGSGQLTRIKIGGKNNIIYSTMWKIDITLIMPSHHHMEFLSLKEFESSFLLRMHKLIYLYSYLFEYILL